MKCEYHKVKLADLTTTGKGTYGIAASGVEKNDNLYTYLRITDINDDGTLNQSDMKSVADDDAAQYLLKPNDIVFARTGGSTGRNYFYDEKDGTFVYAGFLIKFSIDPLKVNPKYIKYFCQSDVYKNWVRSFNTGSTRGNINAQTFGNMEIPLPPREQQDYLVSVLEPLDEKIAINREINENLERQAQALVKEYCSSTDSEIALGSIMNFVNGFAFQSKSYQKNGKYRIVTIKNVQDGRIDTQGAAYIDEVPAKMKNECYLRVGDILLSLTGNVGRVGIVFENNLLLNQRVAKFTSSKDILPLLYFFFRLSETKVSLETIAKGTAQQNLSPIETLKLSFPYDEDKALILSQTLKPMFDSIVNNSVESSKLAQLRDSLLPKLMSGELDVSDIDL
mgnify:CR=1 FL=1